MARKTTQAKALRLSDALSLPTAFATSRNMVLAQSGAGKSNVCVVLAEEMHRVGIPWIAIDPKGDWYGVRSSRDGKGRGLDVPVFGGEFGDIPLSPLAGARMAELVAAGKLAGVFDVSDFPKPSDVSRFLTDFATTLLKKQRTPLHLFLEECSDYLPQGGYRGQIDPLAAACVGAMKRLATKGRFRGIGYTVISQRAAEVNKSVLYQCETLIALRMVGDLDVKWIEGWVKRGSKRAPELLDTLHELRDGECWVWSPQRLKIIERVQARRRETFDSGQAPEVGKARVVPKMAPVEIEALRKELADLEEQAKADDPKELRRRIAELEKALRQTGIAALTADRERRSTVTKEIRVEVPTVDRKSVERLSKAFQSIFQASERFAATMKAAEKDVSEALFEAQRVSRPALIPPTFPPPSIAGPRRESRPTNGMSHPKPSTDSRDPTIGDSGLCRMLIALAQRPEGLARRALGLRAGLSSKTGTFGTYLSRARTAGWIEGKSEIQITAAGLQALGHYEPLPTGYDLLNYWIKEVGDEGGAARMLHVLADTFPTALSRSELAERANLSAATGTFGTYLSRLRGLELIEGKSEIRLSEELIG